MLALIAIVALSQTPQHRLFLQPNLPRNSSGPSYAFFEFAPSSGAGMGVACACTTPSGAKGETLTFTRASSGTCLKNGTTGGIANGDMVTCTTDQPRVMPGGDGTGGLGLLVEGARTNGTARSQEFENAAWTVGFDAAPRTPVITANQAPAPDGTTTADRLQVPATTGGQYSQIFQGGCPASNPETASLFIKGVSGSGTLDVVIQGATTVCVACAYVAGSWSRCAVPLAAASVNFAIGSNAVYGGGCLGAAADVYIWGAQCEGGAFASSYIATAGATVTRSGDVGYLSIPSFPASPTYSMASTVVLAGGTPTSAVVGGEVFFDATNVYQAYSSTNTLRQFVFIGGVTKADTAGASPQTLTLSASSRVSESYGGSTSGTICVNGTCSVSTLTAFTPLSGALRYYVGGPTTDDGSQGFAVTKRTCFDPAGTRCL